MNRILLSLLNCFHVMLTLFSIYLNYLAFIVGLGKIIFVFSVFLNDVDSISILKSHESTFFILANI